MRQRRFSQVRIFVDAGDRGAAMRDVVGAFRGDLGDLVGDVIAGLGEPAAGLNSLEMPPRLRGQLLGEVFDDTMTRRPGP